jgi:hypothetical protein
MIYVTDLSYFMGKKNMGEKFYDKFFKTIQKNLKFYKTFLNL